MKKLLITPVLLSILVTNANAQLSNWAEKPVRHTVKPLYSKESAVILEDERTHEFKADEKQNMWVYVYNRRLIRLNDDKGVEMYNKIYVHIPANSEVVEIKGRTIAPGDKVINVPKEKIFNEEDEGRSYKKFALEGIEKGSEIEYVVVLKKEVALFGLDVFQSSSTPIEKAKFTLMVPDHLQFTVKGYNGFIAEPDTVINEKRIYVLKQENIDVLDDDKYAVTAPYSSNVQYKLSYNLDKDKNVRMNTWNELARNVYHNYNTYSEKEVKAMNGYLKQMKLSSSLDEEGKIIAIEDYIKTNINSADNAIGDDADKIDKIITNKVSGNFGFVRLFQGLLTQAGIKNQVVFPNKRDDLQFDEELENFLLVDDPLFYFPGPDKFLDPVNVAARYPYIQPYHAGTNGIFLKPTTIGDFKTALPTFDTIPLLPYEKSFNNLYLDMSLNASMDSLLLHSKQSLGGYSATVYRPIYVFLEKDKQDEFTRDIIKSIGNSESISNIRIENKAMIDGSKDLPLNIISDISNASLIENAGSRILIKIGEVIGTQEQMYQDKKRHLPVIIQYPHALDRFINFKIPKGFKIKNPEALNLNVTYKESDGTESMGFVSSYKIEGDQLKIVLHEFYKSIYYPLDKFEDFRKVINAAADFNKVVLVLEKM